MALDMVKQDFNMIDRSVKEEMDKMFKKEIGASKN